MARPLFVVLAVVAALIPIGVRAQGPRERTLFVSAVDKNGEPVTDLTVRDFIVREDRVPREVLRASKATEPFDIALLVDNSTAAEPALLFLRPGLTRFVTAMHSANQIANQAANHIALIGLADRPTIITDYTNTLASLTNGVGKVFAFPNSGMTLLDALVETSKGLERREAPRAAIIAVVTDGAELGHYDDKTIIEALKKAGVGFYAVTVGHFAATDPIELRYRIQVLENGTRETGGRHDNILAASGLPVSLEKLGRQLSSQYKVVYSRPESLIPPDATEVTVKRPGVSARGTPARGREGQR